MGYNISSKDCKFLLKNENEEKAFESLKEFAISDKIKQLRWIQESDILDAENFEEAMENCCFDVYRDTKDGFGRIRFNAEYYDKYDLLLEAISPYVEDGSYIEMFGEDGNMWRWYFNNGKLETKYPKIIWE